MEGACVAVNVKRGSKEEYIGRHNEIWPELVDLIRKYGFSNQTIFINNNLVIAYLECNGEYATQAEKYGQEELSIAWQEYFDDIIFEDSSLNDEGGRYTSFEEVWHLD